MTHAGRSVDSRRTDPPADNKLDGNADDVFSHGRVAADALRTEVTQLRQAMDSRATIEQAKGIVMCRYGIDADSAFQLLRRWSMETNVKVRIVALMLVDVVAKGTVTTNLEAAVLAMIDAATQSANGEGVAGGQPSAPAVDECGSGTR